MGLPCRSVSPLLHWPQTLQKGVGVTNVFILFKGKFLSPGMSSGVYWRKAKPSQGRLTNEAPLRTRAGPRESNQPVTRQHVQQGGGKWEAKTDDNLVSLPTVLSLTYHPLMPDLAAGCSSAQAFPVFRLCHSAGLRSMAS